MGPVLRAVPAAALTIRTWSGLPRARLREAGLDIVLPLVTEPWGQRRFQVAGPGGLLVEVLQTVAPDPAWLAANGLAG